MKKAENHGSTPAHAKIYRLQHQDVKWILNLMNIRVHTSKKLEGIITPPGDKSISHRAALLNSIATGTSHVSNFCVGDDRTSMFGCLKGLGVKIERHTDCKISGDAECFKILGEGLHGMAEPQDVLNAGNSGTTMRLVSGLLAGLNFFSVITGDESLRKRPMGRITTPLRKMGAVIDGRNNGSLAPLSFHPASLSGIEYTLPVASAQLKSCITIAGLFAEGDTVIHQPAESRDHTERMLSSMGANLRREKLTITVSSSDLQAKNVRVPCDISGSAFWLVAACCHQNASITLKNVGMNPTRTGVIEVLKAMNANISISNARDEGGEPVADITAVSSEMKGININGPIIPRVVDELPIISLAACFAAGKTRIQDASELRVKESDRIKATVNNLTKLGAVISELDDGMVITGGKQLNGTELPSYGDHRIAMTNGIAGLVSTGTTTVLDSEVASVSYPSFWETLGNL